MTEEGDRVLLEFHNMGLDDRILKAIADMGWSKPTAIQERAIPLYLEGKDVLARARTGSGKTGAFVVPLLHKILQSKENKSRQVTRALIVTPTKELASQVRRNVTELCSSCSRDVKCVDVSQPMPFSDQRPMLVTKPDIVVGTPSRILGHIKAGNLNIKDCLEHLIIDEADLVFSFGHEEDMKIILSHLPNIYQACLMSATLSEDVKTLQKLVLHNPVILKLKESQLPEESQLAQYLVQCEEQDKFVVIYALFKLELIHGRSLIFVNSIDRSYRLKLYLEQFGIQSCVLNSALPLATRCHVVNQFNRGLYDIIIASDESDLVDLKPPPLKPPTVKKTSTRPARKKKFNMEYGVSRGIDFDSVSNIINFDFPVKADSYIHRVGRTARGDSQGTALSLVSIKEMPTLEEVKKKLAASYPDDHDVFKKFQFKMEEVAGFRYRAQDALSRVTRRCVRDARMKEIKRELFQCQRLKTHFEENPRDAEVLRHDGNSKVIKSKPELKNVPFYLVPSTLKGESNPTDAGGVVADESNPKKRRNAQYWSHKNSKLFKTSADPLKTFRLSNRKKFKH